MPFTGEVDGVWLRLRARVRRRWRSALLVALLGGIAGGAVLALAAGARRTDSSADRYTAASGGDFTLGLYQPFGPPLTETIAALPSVTEARSITFVTAFPAAVDGVGTDVNPFAGDDRGTGSRVVDGRFTDPAAADELVVNPSAAEALDVEVGQRLTINSFSTAQVEAFEVRPDVPLEGPTFDATVVGVVEAPSDLDDPSPTIVFSRGVLDAHPDIGVVASILGVRAAPGISADQLLTEVRAAAGEIPLVEDDPSIVRAGARRAVDLHTTALWIVTAVTAGVTLLLLVQLAVRQRRAGSSDDLALRALGYSRGQAAAEGALEAAAIGVIAAIVAVAIAVAASGLFPIGVLRIIEPARGLRVDVPALLLGAVAVVVVFAVVGAIAAVRNATRSRAPARLRTGPADVLAAAGAGPSLVIGARFAWSSGGSGRTRPLALAAGIIAAVAGLAGALVVGLSLVRMIDDRAIWGADYDATAGNPFVPAPGDIVTPVAADPDIAGLTAATDGALTIDGRDVSVLAFEPVRGGILPVVLDGRVPAASDEIALGQVLARQLERSIGDTVTVTGGDGQERYLRVVGHTVTAGDAGDGASMTFEGYQALVPDATRNLLLLNYRAGADLEAVSARLVETAYAPPDTDAVPPAVAAFDRVVPAPYALAVVLAVLAASAIGYHLTTSVRRRTRDLAVLRALGADRRQLRAIVHWQASYIAGLALVVAVPIGIAVGGRVQNAIANSVGVVPVVAIPVLFVLAVVVGALVVANVAATAPGRRATRAPAATVLHEAAATDG